MDGNKMEQWRKERTESRGTKGEPGPVGAHTELQLVGMLIRKFEEADYHGLHLPPEMDGKNPRTAVDSFALEQALDVLKNYEALLKQPLHELIAPVFFNTERQGKMPKPIR